MLVPKESPHCSRILPSSRYSFSRYSSSYILFWYSLRMPDIVTEVSPCQDSYITDINLLSYSFLFKIFIFQILLQTSIPFKILIIHIPDIVRSFSPLQDILKNFPPCQDNYIPDIVTNFYSLQDILNSYSRYCLKLLSSSRYS